MEGGDAAAAADGEAEDDAVDGGADAAMTRDDRAGDTIVTSDHTWQLSQ